MSEVFYLRPNVQVEPLIDRWYAWPYLIPPAAAARNITERHFKIMQSYIDAPKVHANAVKNPKMLGGPFMDYEGLRVNEILNLLNRTRTERARLVRLSAALDELDRMLCSEANGLSMHPLYAKIPEVLKGYVELVYDLNNRPSFRLIEGLLYRSQFYDDSMQSLMLSLTNCDDRPFVLSTPRLDGPGLVRLPWRFADERVNRLFRLKSEPRPWEEIICLLETAEGDREFAPHLFTTEPPRPYARYEGAGIRWRYFGHACILIEMRGFSLLFDPVLSYTYESGISRYTYEDLPDSIDYVLITHNHQDHILFETLLQIRNRVKSIIVPRAGSGCLADPSLKLALENIGFSNVRELSEMETIDLVPGCQVAGVPFLGEHSDLAIATKLAYLVRVGDIQLMFAADSCNIEPRMYEHVRRAFGKVDVLFLGMECDGAPLSWLYGPLLFHRPERLVDESRRLSGSDFAQAAGVVERLGCREVYVYAMGQEPWLNYIMCIRYTEQSRPITESNRLLQYCAEHGTVAERLFGEKEIQIEQPAYLSDGG
jgi:L-ascorbate metabolism protein UlaG (beta-lactamase superfamily)